LAALDLIGNMPATPGIVESVKAGRLALLKELGFDTAGALERALIDHVVLCWLRLQLTEQQYTGNTRAGGTLQQGEFWERRLSAVQRRYLRACETLTRIRRLALPVMQVNVGEQQVNVVKG
jgi:hypothetical protein